MTGSKVEGKKALGEVILRGIEPLFASTCSKLKSSIRNDYRSTGKRINTHRGQSNSQRRYACSDLTQMNMKQNLNDCKFEDNTETISDDSVVKNKQQAVKENVIITPINVIVVSHKKKQNIELHNQSTHPEPPFKSQGVSGFVCFGRRVCQNSTQYPKIT